MRIFGALFAAAEVATAKKAFHDPQMVGRSQEQSLLRTIIIRDESGRTMKWDEQLEAKVRAVAQSTIVKAGDFK